MIKYKLQDWLFNIYAGYYFISMVILEKMKPEIRKRYQIRKIKKLLKRAYALPIYKDKFDANGVKPQDFKNIEDLVKFPSLTKEEYRRWMNEELEKEEVKYFKITKTSGSTGIPTTNIFPPDEYAHHYMADFFCWWLGGYNPFRGISLTRQPGDESVGNKTIIQKLGLLRRETFSTKWDREKIVDRINKVKPDFILANSSELIYIAQYIIENDLEVHKPSFFCPTGENIDGNSEKILKKVYGDGLINIYGGSEMADFSVKRPGNSYYDVIDSLVALCITDDKGNKFESGEGSILVTPLYRKKYPLINYELGDIVTLEKENGFTRISEISGRKNDVFSWKSGKQTIFMRLYEITEHLTDVFQIRFIQKSYTHMVIQLVLDMSSKKTTDELEFELTQMLAPQFDKDTIIEYEWVDVIRPEENGKIRMMISYV